MQPLTHFDRFEIALVAPRNPLNIGAAARAMANFGFSRLTVVAPYQAHWREAQSAVGAEDLLRNARVSGTLQEAVAGAALVFGTASLTYRVPEQPVVSLPDAVPLVREELARGGRIALVFGPEKHGLTRNDLSLCHRLMVIPTAPRQPSMNLGQAVAVCLYELARAPLAEQAAGAAGCAPAADKPRPSTAAHLGRLAGLIEEVMQESDYSPAAMRSANRHDIDLLLRRLGLNEFDTTRMLGFFRRILRQLRR